MALGLARIERGDLLFGGARFLPARAALGKPRIDGCGTLAERLDYPVRHACDLEHRVLARLDPVPQLRRAMRQLLPVNRPNLLLQLVEGTGLEAAPVPILVLCCVEDHRMSVELRVLRAACRMTEGGDGEVAGFLAPHLPALAHAGRRHMLLNMTKRRFDGCGVCSDQPLVTGNLGHDRDRLGRGEGDIPARPMLDLAIPCGSELLPGNAAFEQLGKLRAVHFTDRPSDAAASPNHSDGATPPSA